MEMFNAAVEMRRDHRDWGLRRKDVEGSWAHLCRRAIKNKDTVVFSHHLLVIGIDTRGRNCPRDQRRQRIPPPCASSESRATRAHERSDVSDGERKRARLAIGLGGHDDGEARERSSRRHGRPGPNLRGY
jgi:hypothetical protein